MSKVIKVSDEVHQALVDLKDGSQSLSSVIEGLIEGVVGGAGEIVDPEVQRLIKAIKREVADIHSVVYDIQASLEAGEAAEHMAVGLPENRSEATPQRKVAGGSEMACCRGSKPCKHWEFNGEVWKNTLSGRLKEVA